MKLGHGRALLHVREFGLDDYRAEFIEACISNQVYDTQCEDSRTQWLGEFFEGSPAWLIDPLVRAYSTVDDQRSLFQMAELLGLLGRRGCERAKRALYDGFRYLEWGFLGDEELLSLDGTDGLLWILSQVRDLEDVQEHHLDSMFYHYDELFGEGEGVKYLDPHSPPAQPLKGSSSSRQPRQGREKPRRASAEEFVEAARVGQVPIGYCRSWSIRASTEELAIVAEAVKNEDNPEPLERLLRCFMDTGLPEYWPGLLDLCEHEVHDVRWVTYWVLRHHRHPDVRALAIRRLEENRTVEGEFKLFQSNFEKGDAKRILASARRFPEVEEYIFHWALDDILDVAIANPIRETLSLLIYGYEKTPCTNCRLTAVEEMSKRGDLPGWIVEECRQGCDFYLREKLDLWKP